LQEDLSLHPALDGKRRFLKRGRIAGVTVHCGDFPDYGREGVCDDKVVGAGDAGCARNEGLAGIDGAGA